MAAATILTEEWDNNNGDEEQKKRTKIKNTDKLKCKGVFNLRQ